MFNQIFIKSLIIVGLAFWVFSSKASAVAYFAENGTQISEAEYEALCVKKYEDIQELEHILNGDPPKNLNATKHLVAESSANESNEDESDADAEDDEDFEEDEEYDDEVVDINDPLFGINYAFFNLNDVLYVVIIRPAAKGYRYVIPVEFRTVIKNFFYNLRFPIRFVNCLLQFKGTKAMQEAGGFLLNTTIGIAGLGEVASHWDLRPSPEDLGQTLGYWGLGNGFYLHYPILGPSSLRDSAQFIDTFFLDPVSWLSYNKFGGYDWWVLVGIRGYAIFNELSFQIDDIDALKEAALDPYVGIRDAYVAHRNKLIAE
jgi:phospholipid-binding lipoprotein MlaA